MSDLHLKKKTKKRNEKPTKKFVEQNFFNACAENSPSQNFKFA